MRQNRRWVAVLCLLLALCLGACLGPGGTQPGQARPTASPPAVQTPAPPPSELAPAGDSGQGDPDGNTPSLDSNTAGLDENGQYDSKEEVALYLRTYGELPGNYITKDQAEDLGWTGGSVERYAPGMCIGGDRFSNREGLLPREKGRTWTECDIDTLGERTRGSKRLVYSNDGLIYYTDDHYESFQLLYSGEEEAGP